MSSIPSSSDEAAPDGDLSSRSSPGNPKGGPRTVAGRRAVSQNATKHAITSNSPVAGGEDQAQWESFRDDFAAYYAPVGAPEEVLVNKLALAQWVQFRIIRAEVDSINRERRAMDVRAQSYPVEPVETVVEELLEKVDCDIENAVDLLDRLTLLDASTDVGDQSYDAGALVFASTPKRAMDGTTSDEGDAWGPTAGSFRDWISKFSAAHDRTFDQAVETSVRTGRDILAAQKLRAENIEKIRALRAKLTVLPPPVEMEKYIKYDAHQERKIARTLGQLETLQRLRSGQDLLPPIRVAISEE